MKLTDAGLLFAVVLICVMTIGDRREERLTTQTEQKIQYNNALDNAVEAALMDSVEHDSGRKLKVNYRELWDRFLTALYVNFDAMESPDRRVLLENCIPAAAIVEKDKVSFTSRKDGQRFFDSYFYRETYEDYTVDFTLSEYVYVWDRKKNEWLEGNYRDVALLYPVPVFVDGSFDTERRRVILSVITTRLEEMVEEYNLYAKRAGIRYHFSFPVIPKEEWYRTVDDVSMLVLFQGYPYAGQRLGVYNRAAFGGARLRKQKEM